jgi:two-component system, NarL family, sensor histidine kinase DevS
MQVEPHGRSEAKTSTTHAARVWPTKRLHAWIGLTLVTALLVIAGALAKPWSGMVFFNALSLKVVAVSSGSPAENAGVQPGWTLTAVAGYSLEAADRSEDPDALFDVAAIERFYARQGMIMGHLSRGPVSLTFFDQRGDLQTAEVHFIRTPLSSLSMLFWVQWFAGLGTLTLTGWVLAAQPRQRPAQLLFLSATGTALAIWPSAIYTTRELALDTALFRALSAANGLGVNLFVIAFAALLLLYPRQLVPRWLALAMLVLPFIAVSVELADWTDDVRWTRVTPVALGLCVALALSIVQWVKSRREPVERAAMRWIFLSLLASLVFFAAIAVLPALHGRSSAIPQGYLMAFSLLFYGGMAFAVSRYRLFEIEQWSHSIFFYLSGTLLVFLIDLVLVGALQMTDEAGFAVALLVVGFFYLPLRSMVWNQMTGTRPIYRSGDALAAASSIALEPSAAERERRWRDTLNHCFQPAAIVVASDAGAWTNIVADGLTLEVPACIGGAALALHRKAGGRALFLKADSDLVDSLIQIMDRTEEGQKAYAHGATVERQRIARDLHDDIGARLLSVMHQSDERVRSLLQDTLLDIRTLTGALAGEVVPLSQLLAEARHEAAGRLAERGISLNWPPLMDSFPDQQIDYRLQKALSSAIREIVTNVIKHSRASTLGMSIEREGSWLKLVLTDDGGASSSREQAQVQRRNGLLNIEHRISDIGGTACFDWAQTGLAVSLSIPLAPAGSSRRDPDMISKSD